MATSDEKSILRCLIPLPVSFRCADFLSFHARDAHMMAERVSGRGLRKGLLWDGYSACLSITFASGQAWVVLAVDGPTVVADTERLYRMACRMLGLDQPIEHFEARYRDHPVLGPLLASHPGLRVPQTATPFEALSWAIIGQQVSVFAAVAIRRRFIEAVGVRHSGGLWCFPDAVCILRTESASLKAAGLSATKIQALQALAQGIVTSQIPVDDWLATRAVDVMERQLRTIRGIGPWTVSYALLRGFGWLDGSLHGDAAVRRTLRHLLGATEKITEKQAEMWLAEFSPWRALVAAHLWATQSSAGY